MPVLDKNSADIVVSFQHGSGGGGGHKDRNGLGSVRGSNGQVDIAGETILHGN
jgi:hypothetical protein